jgi:hypothetical protein
MPRGDDAAGGEVVAAISVMIRRVPDEHIGRRTRAQLVRGGGGGVGVAAATEDTQVVVARWSAKKELVWRGRASRVTWTPVDEESRRGERLSPERQRSCTVNQESAYTVVNRAKHALGFAVLLRRVGAG